jgi:cation transport regulator ChaC
MAGSHGNDEPSDWVFGYGSLIWKVDFPVLERAVGTIEGWQRRFWQGSHDHRGTPDAPGRVATLVRRPGARCLGVAWRVAHEVFEHLDHREKNGYGRYRIPIRLEAHERTIEGMLYVAEPDNPAWLGDEPLDAMARHIATARGPSGRNADYLLHLADALRELGAEDEHVFELDRRVRALIG